MVAHPPMPPKLKSSAEQKLYLTAKGAYTDADIKVKEEERRGKALKTRESKERAGQGRIRKDKWSSRVAEVTAYRSLAARAIFFSIGPS